MLLSMQLLNYNFFLENIFLEENCLITIRILRLKINHQNNSYKS
jgi:hypothetical protein